MKDGYDFMVMKKSPLGDYVAILGERQIDGHVVTIQSEGLESQDAVAGIILYLDTKIKELTDIKATLKRMIKEE